MKYSQWIGIAAAVVLIVACFIPWAYYPDLQKEFTGFFSERNVYGRPGKLFVFCGVAAIVLFAVPRVWAKRINMMVCVLLIAFSVKSYILYTACYRGQCPDKRAGIFLLVLMPLIMMIAAALPDLAIKNKEETAA